MISTDQLIAIAAVLLCIVVFAYLAWDDDSWR